MIAIIQARMSSERLPGKVLMPINHKPLLQYTIERIQACQNVPSFIIATSTDSSDDPIEDFCQQNNYALYRGPLENVAERFLNILTQETPSAFIRVNGDSPLIDSQIIDRGVQLFLENQVDIVSNTHPYRTYPPGQSIEIVSSKVFAKGYSKMTTSEEFEHVTYHFYQQSNHYNILHFSHEENLSHHRFVVDTHDDFRVIKTLIESVSDDHIHYRLKHIIELSQQLEKHD